MKNDTFGILGDAIAPISVTPAGLAALAQVRRPRPQPAAPPPDPDSQAVLTECRTCGEPMEYDAFQDVQTCTNCQ